MGLKQIRLYGDNPVYSFSVELDAVIYIFKISYNSWVKKSFLQISDVDNNVLISSIPLSMGVDLLAQYQYMENIPKGNLFLYNKNDFSDIQRPSYPAVLLYNEAI